jgi:predicted Zn-dependent protease
MHTLWGRTLGALVLGLFLAQCSIEPGSSQGSGGGESQQQSQAEPKIGTLEPEQARRLQRIMAPLIQHMDNKVPPEKVKMGLMEDDHINAANAGGGQFLVTTGLLKKSSDEQLRAIMAHEVAHEDLGHVAKTQALATGLGVGLSLLEQVFPGSAALSPIAGQLVVNAYTRREESEADAHAVELMQRAGYDGRTLMVNSLEWIAKTEGASGGGFFATHPATADRIEALKQ